MKIDLTYDQVKNLYIQNEYPFKPNEINVFGIRSKENIVDKWNDVLGIVDNGEVLAFSGTTDPGKSPLSKIEGVNINGIFILKPGFYQNCFQKGKHKGKYDALVQFGYGIFKGWRDNNHDGELDLVGREWNDVRGLNMHTTRFDIQVMRVGDFSEACQVYEVTHEFLQVMKIVYGSAQSLFSYALFEEK